MKQAMETYANRPPMTGPCTSASPCIRTACCVPAPCRLDSGFFCENSRFLSYYKKKQSRILLMYSIKVSCRCVSVNSSCAWGHDMNTGDVFPRRRFPPSPPGRMTPDTCSLCVELLTYVFESYLI